MATEAFRQRSTIVSTIRVGPRHDTFSWQDYKEHKPCNELQITRRMRTMYWAITPILVFLTPFGFDFFAPTPKGRSASTCRKLLTVSGYLLKIILAAFYFFSLFVIADRMAGIINIRWIQQEKYPAFSTGEITVATVALQLISIMLATVNYVFLIHREGKIRQVLQDSVALAVQRTTDKEFKSACRRVAFWSFFFIVVVVCHLGTAGYASSADILRGEMSGGIRDVESNATVLFTPRHLIYARSITLLFSRFFIYPFKDCLVCLFCLVCIFARFCFSHLLTVADTRLVQATVSRQLQGEISELHGRHYKTTAIVTSINQSFGFMVFVWISLGAIDLCSVSKLLCDARAGSGPLAQMMVIALVATVYILKLLLSSSLNTEVSESLSRIMRTTSRDEGVTRYPWSLEEKIGTIYYCTSLHFHTPAVTIWGFCSVTRGLVLTVAGTLFSFVLTLCNIG